ncbi:MAG: glycosyltransferase family 4 protein [Planctomycetota bacterium]
MRISYFNYLYDLEGASLGSAVKARCLLAALANRGHEIAIHWRNSRLVPAPPEPLTPRGFLKKRLSPWLNFPMSVLRAFRDLRQEWALIEEERPDLLLVRLDLGRFSGAVLARLDRLPLVLEADSPVCYEHRRFLTDRILPPWLPERLELTMLRAADSVFTPSTTMRRYFVARGVDPERIRTIENGVDPERFRPLPPSETVRRELAIDARPVVGFSGSLAAWHDVDGLLEALDEILRRNEECTLLVAGSGGNHAARFEAWSQAPERRERLHWLRRLPHDAMPRVIAAMDVVLLPAPAMPLPYFSPVKLFEAMAAGCVVVAARQGQVAEIVQHGENGWLFEAGDAQDLVRVSLRALESPAREAIARRARETVVPHYTWDAQAVKLEALLEETLERHLRR